MRSSSLPARPTKGLPWMSSSRPGASPISMMRAASLPRAKHRLFAVRLSAQPSNWATSASSSASVAAASSEAGVAAEAGDSGDAAVRDGSRAMPTVSRRVLNVSMALVDVSPAPRTGRPDYPRSPRRRPWPRTRREGRRRLLLRFQSFAMPVLILYLSLPGSAGQFVSLGVNDFSTDWAGLAGCSRGALRF